MILSIEVPSVTSLSGLDACLQVEGAGFVEASGKMVHATAMYCFISMQEHKLFTLLRHVMHYRT